MPRPKLPLSRIEGGSRLKELLAWYGRFKGAGFSARFDALWKETRQAARKSGLGARDVDRLIAQVRAGDARP